MPDTSPGAGMAADGRDGPVVDGAVDGRGSLDVPEWVSELRRLYVEPKTRAKLRQEGVISPQKRRRGLPGGRGSRRGATDAPAAPEAAPTALAALGAAEEQAGRAGAVPALVAPEALRPAVLEPADPTSLLDESGAPYTPPDRTEEEKVATFLTTYLVATGHATGDETPASEPEEPAADPSPAAPELSARAVDAAVADPADDVAPEVPSDRRDLAGEAAPGAPLDAPDPQPVEAIAPDTGPGESDPRSLADLAGLHEPDPSPAEDLHSESWRAAHEGAGVLVSTGGDAATPNPAATTGPAPDVSHASAEPDPVPAPAAPQPRPDEPRDQAPVEPASTPGRPSTVPAVTLSWREAESFEIGVPDVEDSERAIVVEPPSQLVAERRSRRREVDTEDEATVEPVIVEPLPVSGTVEEAPTTRASARAASGYHSGKRRRAMVVGLVLVMLAIVAWYFLLRGGGGDAATGPTSPLGGSHAVVALSSTSPGCVPGVSAV